MALSVAGNKCCFNGVFELNLSLTKVNFHQKFSQKIRCQQVAELAVLCEPCSGKGWLLCEFCKGQKTNVKGENNNRIYRRCPSCRAIGYVLCSKCKVFKCVTFPDADDGVDLML